MKVKKVYSILLLLVLFIGENCSSKEIRTVNKHLKPRDVNNSPKRYDGQKITVKGFLLLGTNGRSLFQSKGRFYEYKKKLESNNTSDKELAFFHLDCLTLLNVKKLFGKREFLKNKTYILTGLFKANYLDGNIVDLQACSKSALVVDREEVERLINIKP